MARGAVRAHYRQSVLTLLLVLVIVTVGVSAAVVTYPYTPPWARVFYVLVAGLPVSWWYAARTVYRMDLTDTHLRLRAPLASSQIALDDLAKIEAPVGRGVVKVVRRDGRSWKVVAGEGLVDFVQEVGRAAPNAEIRLSGA